MFGDSKIAKNFACSRIKCSAITKEALSPYHTTRVKKNMVYPFSVLIDESHDKTDQSCIRVLDHATGDVRTCFVHMPVVNIGTVRNRFERISVKIGF